ncbi:BTAD domain-containing putative transcriptional regulator [Nocardia sp. NPDC059240]|uniref:BTAD domain-containing putative transcriptional regulator n=1 Tax=Nocardia sp. NPDC059240 TaxID=3346786 RepID=UPI0036B3F6B5
MVTFQVLGPLRASDERGPLALKGPRHRALLARLLIAHGRVVPLNQLIDDLWERPPRDPQGAIQTFVSDLRRSLEPDRKPRETARVLVTAAPGYALRATDGDVDADRFEVLIRAAAEAIRPPDLTVALADLDAALRLWQGPAYAEFTDEHWARAEIDRLDELRSLAIEQRALVLTELTRHSEAVATLEPHLRAHPLRESAWHTLVLALYRSDRQADAMTALRTIRTTLRAELGVDPSPHLRQLEADILTQAPGLVSQRPVTATAGKRSATEVLGHTVERGDTDRARTASAAVRVPDVLRPGGKLVGRDGELSRLREAADQVAASGRARLALVTGIEGAGKTALVEALSAELDRRGWLVAWGPSPADRGAPPNWPWTQITAALAAAHPTSGPSHDPVEDISAGNGAGTAGPSTDRAGAEGVSADGASTGGAGAGGAGAEIAGAEIAGAEGEGAERAGTDSAEEWSADPAVGRFHSQRRALDYLGSVARGGPVLVVFDDLHWAGEETVELLTTLATTPVAGPVLLIGTYRGTDVEAELAGALARMARTEPVRIPLGGLGVDATGELARAVAGTGIEAAVRRIHARAQGNPFFIRELARLWADEGDAALESVPAGVRDVVRQRLRRLSAAEATVLQQAAVIGSEVDTELLVELSADAETVDTGLTAALRAEFLDESGSTGVTFAHALVRDVVYRDIPAPRRSAWHARVGTLLEAAGTTEIELLAHHFARAGTRATAARAGKYASAAASAAERAFAPHQAARLWSDAVTAYKRVGDRRSGLEATMGLVRALALTGRLPEAGTRRAEAIRAAERLGDPDFTARLIVAFDVPALWTDPDDPALASLVVVAAERALHALPTGEPDARVDADLELRCRLLITIALELRATDSPRGRTAAEEAESLAAGLNRPVLLALALNARFMQTFHRAGLAPERAVLGTRLIELSQAHDLVTFEVLGHLIRIQALSATADFEAADRHARAVDALADRYGLPLVSFFTTWYAALRTSLTAPLDQTEAAYRSASAAHPGTAMPGLHRGLLALALVCLRLRHGKPLAAQPDTDWGPHELWLRPLLHLDNDDRDAARTALLAAPDPPPDLLQELRLALLAHAALALREPEVLRHVRDRLTPAAGEFAGAGTGLLTLAPVAHYLNRIDAALLT